MKFVCWSVLVVTFAAAGIGACSSGGDTGNQSDGDGGAGGQGGDGGGAGSSAQGGSSSNGGSSGTGGTLAMGGSSSGGASASGGNGGQSASMGGAMMMMGGAAGSMMTGGMPGQMGGAAALVTVEDTTFMNRGTWLIKAGKYTFYFEKGNGRSGFYRMIDSYGKDWVQAGLGKGAVTNGVPGEWRGFPNATASNFGHPLRNSNSTTVVKDGVMSGEKVILDSSSPTMQFEYWIFPSHIAIKVIKAQEPYCFLIEATPGGSQNGWFVDAKGAMHDKPLYSDSNAPASVRTHDASPEWLYFGAGSSDDVMFLGKTPDDAFVDENYGRPGDMDIYAFGRLSIAPWTRYIPAGQTQHVGVIGFLPKAGSFEAKKAIIEAIMAKPFEAYKGAQ